MIEVLLLAIVMIYITIQTAINIFVIKNILIGSEEQE